MLNYLKNNYQIGVSHTYFLSDLIYLRNNRLNFVKYLKNKMFLKQFIFIFINSSFYLLYLSFKRNKKFLSSVVLIQFVLEQKIKLKLINLLVRMPKFRESLFTKSETRFVFFSYFISILQQFFYFLKERKYLILGGFFTPFNLFFTEERILIFIFYFYNFKNLLQSSMNVFHCFLSFLFLFFYKKFNQLSYFFYDIVLLKF